MPLLRRQKRRFGRLPEEEVMSDINITPLTDVLLVLLIIFLIAAASGIFGFNLHLPKGNPTTLNKKTFKGIMVTIPSWAKDKQAVFVGGNLVRLDILPNYLYAEQQKKKTTEIVMRIDKRVAYGVVIQVMDSAKTAGLSDISFAAPVAR